MPSNTNTPAEMEQWSEQCECGRLMGGKIFDKEEEFDEHPDRDAGYNDDGEWQCEDCRAGEDEDQDDDDDDKCEHCGCKDGSIIIHSFGCVGLCEKCSDIDELPHCPRKSYSGDAEKCEDCVEGWAWIDERVPITYKGTIIGYSKSGEIGIHKFSHRHQ